MGKREVIFEMPKTYGEYRMVCRFGFNEVVDYAWWGYLQKLITKKPLFWGKPKQVWVEIDRCWWSFDINSMEELKKAATKFYMGNVEAPILLNKKAMNL
jgi:hypothetical protein